MIPGLNNVESVGSKPTCRGGRAIVNSSLTVAVSPEGKSKPKLDTSFTPETKKEFANEDCTIAQSIGWVDSNPGSSPLGRERGSATPLGCNSRKYNPITNPIPGYMQNPYIMRERAMSQTQSSRLALKTPEKMS